MAAEVKALTETEARAIYRQQYITGPGFEVITHLALLHLLVDAGVHSGPKRAVQWLQSVLATSATPGRAASTSGVGRCADRCCPRHDNLQERSPDLTAFTGGGVGRFLRLAPFWFKSLLGC
jgi:hypothetical protein